MTQASSFRTQYEQGGDLRTLMDQSLMGIIVVDMDGTVTDVNAAALQILGSPDPELTIGLNVLTMPGLIGSGVSNMFRRAIEQGETFEVEMPYVSHWGKKVYLRATLSPRYDDQERQSGVIQILEDITEQKQAQEQLMQQLGHELALGLATRTLLQSPRDEAHQTEILNMALSYLREATEVGRTYIFRNFHDEELGECMKIVAEACATGVSPGITKPGNFRYPWRHMSREMYRRLRTGKPFGGDVEELFTELPGETLARLRKAHTFSIQLFPIFFSERWWGLVGFDDVETVRQWTPQEIQLLQTMADIFGSTLKRWQAERALQEERDALEARVQKRTAVLERRLRLERVLATAATRLMAREDFDTAMEQSLREVGEVLNADRVLLTRIDVAQRRVLDSYRWQTPDMPDTPDTPDWTLASDPTTDWFRQQLIARQPLYITDTESYLEKDNEVRDALLERSIRAMIMYPLTVEAKLVGVFNVNLHETLTGEDTDDIIAMLDIMANLLNGLLQRHVLIEKRDQQILEQTKATSAMLDAAMLDAEARELSDVVRPILAHIAELSQAQTLAAYELRADGHFVKIAEHGAPGQAFDWTPTFQPSEGMSHWLEVRTEPLLLNADELTEMTSFSHASPQTGVSMIVNVRAWRHFNGLLFCYRSGEEQYSTNQVAMTTALADYMSTVIENFLLRRLAERTAVIEERQRLARDLHDSVSQSLYGVRLFARAGRDALASGNQDALFVNLERVEENALWALKEMRLLLHQLQPLSLEQHGLAQALQQRFEQVEGKLNIETTLEIDPDISLTVQAEEMIYRLASEALNNAMKHAAATRVGVRLTREAEAIVLIIFDNGRGFDPEQASATGMGLSNMRFRAEKAGGILSIESVPDQGTTVRCRIPLEKTMDDG